MKLEVSDPFESLPNHYHPIIRRHIARVPDIFVSTLLLLLLSLLRLLQQQPIYYRQIIVIIIIITTTIIIIMPVPVAARSKAWVCGCSLTGIVGSYPLGKHKYLSVVSVVCWHVEVSATDRSPVQRSPTGCCVSVILKLQH